MAFLLQVWMTSVTLALPDTTALICKGSAFDTERHIPAYIETRQERIQSGKLSATETKFTSPEGKVIADLHLDFVRFPFKPDYAYRDFRNGYEEGAKVEASCIRAYFRDSARAVRKEKALEVPEPCVINGGVGEFVKSHWAEITAGKKVPFNMVVPARLDYYKFVAYVDTKFQVPPKETGNQICKPIVIEPKNSLLAMLLPTIVMYYDPKTFKMVRYQGIVNVADPKGRSLRVRVDY